MRRAGEISQRALVHCCALVTPQSTAVRVILADSGVCSQLPRPMRGNAKLSVGSRFLCRKLLVVIVVIASSPFAVGQVCTEGNTINDGGNVDVTNYDNGESCSWTLVCSSGAPTLAFETFNTEANFDFMYLYEGSDTSGPVLQPALSGSGHAPMSYTATSSSSLFLRFTTDGSVVRPGFTAVFTCGAPAEEGQGQSTCTQGNTIEEAGVINIENYVNNLQCSWTLTCGVGTPSLAFETFETEANFDFMYLYEGSDTSGPVLQPALSGSGHAPMSYTATSSSSLFLRFTTDGSVVRSGFLAAFSCLAADAEGHVPVSESSCVAGNSIDGPGAIHIENYVNSLDCSWTLSCSTGVPMLMFETFETEANFDYIYVYDGQNAGGSCLVADSTTSCRLSGAGHAPMSYVAAVSPSIYLRFTTDGSVTMSGFYATFSCEQGSYFRTSTCTDWGTARAECQDSGGDLVTIESLEKRNAVVA